MASRWRILWNAELSWGGLNNETYCKGGGRDTTDDAAVYSYRVGLSIDVDRENLAPGVGRSI